VYAISPTITVESIFVSATLDTLERVEAEMIGDVHIKLEGKHDDLLANLEFGESTTLTGNHLLAVNPDAIPLSASESEADNYHHYVAKLLLFVHGPDQIYRLMWYSVQARV